jgi:hypothetical protein
VNSEIELGLEQAILNVPKTTAIAAQDEREYTVDRKSSGHSSQVAIMGTPKRMPRDPNVATAHAAKVRVVRTWRATNLGSLAGREVLAEFMKCRLYRAAACSATPRANSGIAEATVIRKIARLSIAISIPLHLNERASYAFAIFSDRYALSDAYVIILNSDVLKSILTRPA